MSDGVEVLSADHNNRKREFVLELRDRGALTFPYRRCDPAPTPDNPVRHSYIDPELGNRGITYVLESGEEGSVLADMVLDFNSDPAYVRDMTLYRLSVEAQQRFDASPMGIRELGRRLRTSPAQIYRLLDQTNYSKTIDRMLELLHVLGAEVEVRVK